MNRLTGKVQIKPVHNYVVWYAPEGFDGILTDASLIDGDGELLLITNGWQYKLISTAQVDRIVTARSHEAHEINFEETATYQRYLLLGEMTALERHEAGL